MATRRALRLPAVSGDDMPDADLGNDFNFV